MKYSRIVGTGSYLPKKVLTNEDLARMVNTSDAWIVERTGIKSRHIMAPDETVVTMAHTAAKAAIAAAEIDKNKIQMIIVATCTPEKFFPNVATYVQRLLDISHTSCPAFDINVVCSGFIYALSVADQYIRSGVLDNVLVIGVDSLTRLVDWTDRTTCILFGDGAGAVVLSASKQPGIYSTHLHADGDCCDMLYVEGSTCNASVPHAIKMQGNAVFKVSVTKLGAVVEEALRANNVDKSELNWLIPHQANLRIIEATAKRLGMSMDKVILTIEEHGNTSAASVPIALDIGVRDGRVKHNDLILLEAFGAGFGWGAALIRY